MKLSMGTAYDWISLAGDILFWVLVWRVWELTTEQDHWVILLVLISRPFRKGRT